jgi:sugar phosphate isomerase/epimerase
MNIRNQPPLHLTYCLNVHPGETWEENLAAIEQQALAVRARVAPERPFGLGLRLSAASAKTLGEPGRLAAFKDFLADKGLYVFTINGFPYGTFHSKPVKADVYRPDWTAPERVDYTIRLAHILAALLPDGAEGSISTVPLTYKAWMTGDEPLQRIVANLAHCVAALHALREQTGHDLHLGLEPEPDCALETTDEVIRFFEGPLLQYGVPHLAARLGASRQAAEAALRRHLGVCFDTCHLALQFEPLSASLSRLVRHGIRLSKVQLSSALETHPSEAARLRLKDFCDPVYLHQVRALDAARQVLTGYPDLPDALAAPLPGAAETLWRIHFHVPLYFEGYGELRSTSRVLDAEFWAQLPRWPLSHLEIETYTFHVLPPALQSGGVTHSISREFEWVLSRLMPVLREGAA